MKTGFRLSKRIYIVLLGIICLLSLTLNITYASFNSAFTTDDTIAELSYDFNIGISNIEEFELVSVSSKDYVTFNVDITNSYDSTLYYGVWYNTVEADDTSKVTIAKLDTSANETSGSVDTDTTITVTVIIINKSSSDIEVKIGVGSSTTSTDDIEYNNGNTLITLTESEPTNSLLSEYVTNLYSSATKTSVTTTGSEAITQASDANLMEDSYGNIRYYGASPNNYVYFNDELWRIIGVFEVEDENGDTESRVKIIRDESIGTFNYDTKSSGTGSNTSSYSYGSNDWSDAQLMMLLNPGYEDGATDSSGNTIYEYEGSLYWNSGEGTYYSYTSIITGATTITVNFTSTSTTPGLNDEAKELIKSQAKYYLGAVDTSSSTSWWGTQSADLSSVYANDYYDYERGDLVYSGHATEWTGYVGLVYPSDYAYASDLNVCTYAPSAYSSDTTNCTGTNWLFTGTATWTTTPPSATAYLNFFYNSSGNVSYTSSSILSSTSVMTNATRPVLYLDYDVIVDEDETYVESSDTYGSSTNPFQISK